MPRRKQLNPQPVKLDSEDTVGAADPASFILESNLLFGGNLQFEENDPAREILEPECGEDTAELIGLEEFPLCFTPLSMETDHNANPGNELEEGGACARCGQSLSLAGPYCPRCGYSNSAPSVEDEEEEAVNGGMEEEGEGEEVRLHSCQLCSFSSRYSNHLKRHMKTHNGEKPYRCPLCTYASAQLVNLQRHLRIHTGEKPYNCSYCTFACSSLGNLKRHQRMHTQQPRSHTEEVRSHTEEVRSHTEEVRSHTEEVRSHTEEPCSHTEEVRSHTEEPRSKCSSRQDEQTMGTAAGAGPAESVGEAVLLSDHHGNHLNHDGDLLQDGGGLGGGASIAGGAELLFPFSCRLCGGVLPDEDGSSAQICHSCTLDMLSKAPPRGDGPFSCALCPFSSQYPNHLARHMKTHSGEKPYKCPQCNYASAHFDNLKRHHRVHTGEKPYGCQLCDYACGNLANLKRHQRIHSGAKPFQCSICSYSCNQSMNLKRHMLRHTGEKPFRCHQCAYTTGHWDNYKRHQRKHGHDTQGWAREPLANEEEEGEEEEHMLT